uniref:Uncharacterized protein n=1 Tax=Tanacetum cinerariifolium TaxID=118510 RepID=A0A6L2KXC1_TANCI|nr:hypothetical protein [Tanacetum cinerariifolium]
MASVIVCLPNNQKFNFSKYILDNLQKNLEAGVPFYMFPRVETRFYGVVTPLFYTMMVQPIEEIGDLPTADQDIPIPDAPSSFQPQRKHNPKRKEKNDMKENEVLDLENKVIEMKSSHKAKIARLESRVEKLEEENRKIEDIDADAKVNLENAYNLDLAHEETVLSIHDATDADGKKVVEEVVEVITIAKLIVDEVSTAGGELNAVDEEPVSDAPINITIAQPSKAAKTTVDISNAPKAKGIIFHDVEKSTTRTNSSKAQAKWNADMQDNIDWNEVVEQGMSYEEIRPLFEEEYNKVQTLFKKGPVIDVEMIKALRKRTRKENVEKDQTAKKQKGDKLEKENAEKQKLEEQQEPPIIVDYKIYNEGKKEHFRIIRANENHQMYLAFSTMLKNFDREDLEALWKIIKDRFKESQPKEVLDVFLWHTLKVMFEHFLEDNIWKLQKRPKGLARVKNWKLFDSCGVHYVTLDTIHLYLLAEKMYPLTNNTLQQMFNEVRLQIDYEIFIENIKIRRGLLRNMDIYNLVMPFQLNARGGD